MAHAGSRVEDVANLLTFYLDPENRRKSEMEYLKFFHRQLCVEYHGRVSFDELVSDYRNAKLVCGYLLIGFVAMIMGIDTDKVQVRKPGRCARLIERGCGCIRDFVEKFKTLY